MSLFWKIFAWFWGTMIIMGAAVFYVVTALQPEPLPQSWREATAGSFTVYASLAAQAREKSGDEALLATLGRLRRQSGERFWLYNGAARPIGSGPRDEKPPAPPLQSDDDEAPRAGEIGPGIGPMPPDIAARLALLVKKALSDAHGEAQFALQGPMVLVARRAPGPSGQIYALGGELKRPDEGRSLAPLGVMALALLPVALLGTGLCYALARYLVAPVTELRGVARRFASGDFGARSQSVWRDDMGDLSRDFNQMAARIEDLIGAQGRFLGDVSHELRSPLTRLSVALAIARHYETDPQARLALERIGTETGRLNTMIGELLQIARLEAQLEAPSGAGSNSLHGAGREEVDLARLVNDVAADARFEAHSRNRDVSSHCEAALSLRGNASLLQSALENVVRNAVRHTREGTSVEISLSREKGENFPLHASATGIAEAGTTSEMTGGTLVGEVAVLRVRDFGEGVPEAELSELFKPFYRVESARERDSGGAGLGLAIAQRAVRAHRGLIRACNAPEGGLLVEIMVPLHS